MGIIRKFMNIIDKMIFQLAFLPLYYITSERLIVTGPSMEPVFIDGHSVFLSKIYYKFNKVQFNDVVVISNTNNDRIDIKRIIGLPTDTLSISENSLLINGTKLIDSKFFYTTKTKDRELKFVLGRDEYFVLGDNRSASNDSRDWGTVPIKNISGKAWITYWPFTSFSIEKHG